MSDTKKIKVINPFCISPVVMAKVSLDELLEMVRKVTNKGYMPSATGEALNNSSPTYVRVANKQFNSFPDTDNLFGTSYCAFEDSPTQPAAIFAYISLSDMKIVINLQTEETCVRVCGSDVGFMWPKSVLVAIDRLELNEQVKQYLF